MSSESTIPLPPRKRLCNRYYSNKHTLYWVSFDTVLGLFWHCTRSLLTLYFSNKHTPWHNKRVNKHSTHTRTLRSLCTTALVCVSFVLGDERDNGGSRAATAARTLHHHDLDQRRMGRPATSTWSTDFRLREGSSREEIGKWLKNKSIPWQRRRRCGFEHRARERARDRERGCKRAREKK